MRQSGASAGSVNNGFNFKDGYSADLLDLDYTHPNRDDPDYTFIEDYKYTNNYLRKLNDDHLPRSGSYKLKEQKDGFFTEFNTFSEIYRLTGRSQGGLPLASFDNEKDYRFLGSYNMPTSSFIYLFKSLLNVGNPSNNFHGSSLVNKNLFKLLNDSPPAAAPSNLSELAWQIEDDYTGLVDKSVLDVYLVGADQQTATAMRSNSINQIATGAVAGTVAYTSFSASTYLDLDNSANAFLSKAHETTAVGEAYTVTSRPQRELIPEFHIATSETTSAGNIVLPTTPLSSHIQSIGKTLHSFFRAVQRFVPQGTRE